MSVPGRINMLGLCWALQHLCPCSGRYRGWALGKHSFRGLFSRYHTALISLQFNHCCTPTLPLHWMGTACFALTVPAQGNSFCVWKMLQSWDICQPLTLSCFRLRTLNWRHFLKKKPKPPQQQTQPKPNKPTTKPLVSLASCPSCRLGLPWPGRITSRM